MKSDAMKNICAELERSGFDLSQMDALEFFAREGDWQTLDYADKVRTLEAWEIDPQFEPGLRKNLPRATIRIDDSFAMARLPENAGRFDLVVLDNPQNVYGPAHEFCEHFQALEIIAPVLKRNTESVLIFNVNIRPFNYAAQHEWQVARNNYYGVADASLLSLEFLLGFYRNLFERKNLTPKSSFAMARNAEYLYYLVFCFERQ